MRTATLLLAVALFAPSAFAVESAEIIEKPLVADTPETFARQTSWIEQEMQLDGRYEFIKPADKQRVRALLDQMSNLLQRAETVAAMDNATRIQLFNDQEEVNGLLKRNDANRLVCESRQPTGSHIPVTHCHTYRQVEETARNTKIGMQQFDLSRVCNGPGGDSNACAPGSHQRATGGH